jgi:HTH-type transcriptional regulator/antitoxin HigA
MRTSTGTIRFDDLPTTYEGLVQLHMPRPIHDEVELENATDLIDLMAGHDLSADQEDYLDLLSDLVAKYEEGTSPIGEGAAPREVLAWLIEEHGMSITELGKLLGDRSLGSRILSGERSLSKSHIRIVAEHFKVSPAAFI